MTQNPAPGQWPDPNQQPPYQTGPQQGYYQQQPPPQPGYQAYYQGGPQQPPPPRPEGFASRWGIVSSEGRPRQVTWLLQLLWLYLCGAAVIMLFSVVSAGIASLVFSAAGLFNALLFGFVIGAVTVLMIWAVSHDELGRFGFDDPRTGLHIGLGFLGLNALCGFVTSFSLLGFLKFLPALVEVAAIALCFVILAGSAARTWLADRPGNWKRPVPRQRPGTDDDA